MSAEPATEIPVVDEREIVDRARLGDRDALGALYDLYVTQIYRYVLTRTSNESEAEDITAEIFERVIEHVHRFRWQDVPFSAWLFRIARNQVVTHHRGRKGHVVSLSTPGFDLEDSNLSPDDIIEHLFTTREVFAACEKLATAQREVIALRFGAGLSVRETAKSLGKSENNVKVLQHKAIARLQKLLGA